ncbi:MAG TPA: ABC transporter ATP-binding protein, partial [Gammaproteobacteria bacterium]|nr:ABC transporter ATP-binding protein [Gammaproteobacteria bacterium]
MASRFDGYLGIWRYGRRALALVWSTHRGLTVAIALLTCAAGLLPAGMAYVGKLIVDAVVAALTTYRATGVAEYAHALELVLVLGVLAALIAAVQRG